CCRIVVKENRSFMGSGRQIKDLQKTPTRIVKLSSQSRGAGETAGNTSVSPSNERSAERIDPFNNRCESNRHGQQTDLDRELFHGCSFNGLNALLRYEVPAGALSLRCDLRSDLHDAYRPEVRGQIAIREICVRHREESAIAPAASLRIHHVKSLLRI